MEESKYIPGSFSGFLDHYTRHNRKSKKVEKELLWIVECVSSYGKSWITLGIVTSERRAISLFLKEKERRKKLGVELRFPYVKVVEKNGGNRFAMSLTKKIEKLSQRRQ